MEIENSKVLALQADSSDESYHVGTGKQTGIRDFCDTIQEITRLYLSLEYKAHESDDSRQRVRKRKGCANKVREGLGFEAKVGLSSAFRRLIAWHGLD